MAKYGYFYLHTNLVQRSQGHSAVAAAAYQSGQRLEQQEELQGQIAITHRKILNKGDTSLELRKALSALQIELGSGPVKIEKQGRREWLLTTENSSSIRFKAIEKKAADPVTGKRRTIDQWLDVYARRTHNYANREDIKAIWLHAPTQAPAWLRQAAERGLTPAERRDLWNMAEAAETARDGRTARRFQLALHRDLSFATNLELVRRFAEEHLTRHQLAVDVAVHEVTASDGKPNLHAHLLVTTRDFLPDGSLNPAKNPDWEKKARIYAWRQGWATLVNAALEENGSPTRIDPRSYKERGIKRKPAEHLNKRDLRLEKAGIATEAGDRNRKVRHDNKMRHLLAAEDRRQPRPITADSPLTGLARQEQRQLAGLVASVARTETRRTEEQSSGWHRHKQRLLTWLPGGAARAAQPSTQASLWEYMRQVKQYMVDRAKRLGSAVLDKMKTEQQRGTTVSR